MRKIAITFRGKSYKEFESVRHLGVYTVDLLIKVSTLIFFALAGILNIFISSSNSELSRYVGIYIFAVLIWGLILLRYIFYKKRVFGKTQFDVYFMGILTFCLVSVLLSEDRTLGVFGRFGTWSYSIITILSISILYYVLTLIHRYSRGIKWLNLAFLVSVFVSGIYYTRLFFIERGTGNLDYLRYVVLAMPLSIGMLFIFKRLSLKITAFVSLLLSLFLIALYSRFLAGSMFLLSIGVLALFLLFYFSFWAKNGVIIINFLRELLRGKKKLKDLFGSSKRELFIIVVMVLMALWILGFMYFGYRYFQENLGSYLLDWVRDDLGQMEGVRMWLIGKNDLSYEFSSFEILNILGNYGLITVFLFVMFFIQGIYLSAKLTLKFLYRGTFRDIILLSSIFITLVSIFFNFLLSRFSPMILILFVFTFCNLAIIQSLLKKDESYELVAIKDKILPRTKVIMVITSLIVAFLIVIGISGILSGLDRGLFEA